MFSKFVLILSLTILINFISVTNTKSYKNKFHSPKFPRRHREPNQLTPRITGGHRVYEGYRPFQLYMVRGVDGGHHIAKKKFPLCGASLTEIGGKQFAITAAHCPTTNGTLDPDFFGLVAGDVRISDTTGIEQFRWITKIAIHESYDWLRSKHDIALLFIDKPFELNYYVKTIDLPNNYKTNPDQYPAKVVVSGWGSIKYEDGPEDDLLEVELDTLTQEECNYYDDGGYFQLSDGMQFCAGEIGIGGKGFCAGDSGGPGTGVDEEGHEYLAGVVSFSFTEICGDKTSPDIFTKVSRYMDWIIAKVEEEQHVPGGYPIVQGDKPYLLYLLQSIDHHWNFRCGATLVSVFGRQFALTAATCVDSAQSIDHFGLFGGDIHISDVTGLEQWRWVTKITFHEGFDRRTLRNNLAILHLEEPYDLTDDVSAIRLPEYNPNDPDWFERFPRKVEFLGWGSHKPSGEYNDYPIALELLTLMPNECKQFDPRGDLDLGSGNQICVSKAFSTTCTGDPGGPVVSNDDYGDYLEGVVSYSIGTCNHPNLPDIYTKVSRYVSWIIPNVAGVDKLTPPYPLNKGDKPYLAYLIETRDNGKVYWRCGATLVEGFGKVFVVTNAHCITLRGDDVPKTSFGIVAGDIRLRDNTGQEQFRKVKKIYLHEEFDWRNIKHDLAILFLEGEFKMGGDTGVGTVRLREPGKDDINGVNWYPNKVEVAGWGSVQPLGRRNDGPQAAEMPTLKWLECTKYDVNGRLGFHEGNVICLGKLREEACVMDFGSGVIGKDPNDGGEYLVGGVSFMKESCGDPNFPVVITKLGRYMDWIHEKVKKG